MTRALATALLLVACADTAETLATAPCGWSRGALWRLKDGSCWLLDPPDGLAVTEAGANACAAESGQRARVWPAGAQVALWTRSWDLRELHVEQIRVECPE